MDQRRTPQDRGEALATLPSPLRLLGVSPYDEIGELECPDNTRRTRRQVLRLAFGFRRCGWRIFIDMS